MNRRLAFACALLFASLTVSSACFAQPIMRATRLVTYDDLDLSTPSGQKSLHRRLERALNQLCLDPSGPGPGGTVDPTCKSDGWQAVRPQVAIAVAQAQAGKMVAGTQTPIRESDADRRGSSR